MAIWLDRLAIDRWRLSENCRRGEGRDAAAFALLADTAHGPRITAANAVAFALGVREGMRLADARSLHPALQVGPADPAGDEAFLQRLALWAQRWGPWSAVDSPDGLLVDLTGAAHLSGGEEVLLADARACFARRDLAARLAIAPTAGAAWALARFASGVRKNGIVGPEDDLAVTLAGLPVEALRLDADVLLLLRRLGFKRIGDMATIGRDAVRRRFRNRANAFADPLLRLDQVFGRVAEPLVPVVPVERPMAQRRLMEPIRHRELLDRIVADCATDLARMLEARREGARRLELALWRVDGEVLRRDLEMALATRDAAHIARLFASRLDDVDAGFGIELVRLQAVWVQDLALEQEAFDNGGERHGTTLSVCLDRLAVRLGQGAVRRPVPHASHVPERAQRWQAPLASVPAMPEGRASAPRPLKLLLRPEPIAVLYATPDGFPRQFRWRGTLHEVARVEGPERIAPEWWRDPSGTRLRDYYRIEDRAGRRYWLYRHGRIGDGRGGVPQWFLQGLFA